MYKTLIFFRDCSIASLYQAPPTSRRGKDVLKHLGMGLLTGRPGTMPWIEIQREFNRLPEAWIQPASGATAERHFPPRESRCNKG
jgi:hypothetical protein